MISTIEPGGRLDLFEAGDQTALVCLDVPEVQRIVVEQLHELSYKIHTGLSADDSLLKMRTHVYDVIILSSHFNATGLDSNPIYLAASSVSSAQRRRQVVVLVGSEFSTGDEMQAFTHSVDLVIGISDIINLRPVLRRIVLRHGEFYAPFHDAEKNADAA